MSKDSNIEALYTFYKQQVASLTDEEARLTCAVYLDDWRGATYAYRGWAERGATSYSIAGRSFTFKTRADAAAARDDALSSLQSYIGGTGASVTYVDNSGSLY